MELPSHSPSPTNFPAQAGAGTRTQLGKEAALPFPVTPPPRPARFVLVRGTIILTILFVLGMTALIWSRWHLVSLPTSELILIGDPSVDGSTASVTQRGQPVGSMTLDKDDDYCGEIWLIPGEYDLVVIRDNRPILRSALTVRPEQRIVDTLSLKTPYHQSGPTTGPR